MPSKVLICGNVKQNLVWATEDAKEILGAADAEIVPFTSQSREEFLNDLKGKYSDIVAIYRHNDSANSIGVFDPEIINALPSSVKYICHNGAGYDQIDLPSSTARGIEVSHTPGAVDDATATTAMFLILSSLRQYWKAETNARSGKWKQGLSPAHDPEGKTIGIIGMGGIGSVVGKRCLAFGMKVIYHNRNPISPAPDFECEYVANRDELLKRSDIVSLNLPLNDKTKGSFGKAEFEKMKDGSILINTARGGVVDQEALIEALTNGKLYSAGLDVFPNEPDIDQRLVEMNHITLLPHMGTEARGTQRKMECQALKNIASALQGKGLINQVAEQKQKK